MTVPVEEFHAGCIFDNPLHTNGIALDSYLNGNGSTGPGRVDYHKHDILWYWQGSGGIEF